MSSDDLEGLALLRDHGPGDVYIAAGEYGYDLPYFHRTLAACAVDCLQADVTRCGGIPRRPGSPPCATHAAWTCRLATADG